MDRREFLEFGGGFVLAATSCGYAVRLLTTVEEPSPKKKASDATAEDQSAKKKWGMVIDITKCKSDCTACLKGCEKENNVAHHGDKRWDVHWIRKVGLKKKGDENAQVKPVILLCNHCDNPPCVRVCPTKATWRRDDGIVMMDWHRCIGCRYCVAACPYGSRSFNWRDPRPAVKEVNAEFPTRTRGVVEKCTFCDERLSKGRMPACVEACTSGCLKFGDLGDPDSEVRQILRERHAIRRKSGLGTGPQVYYLV